MIPNFSNSAELMKMIKETKRFGKLVAQLEKDFGLANIPIDLSSIKSKGPLASENLQILLREKLYFLLMEKFTDYINLLYIVDVPENAFKKIEVTDEVEMAEHISFLVLCREFQKVLLKEQYGT